MGGRQRTTLFMGLTRAEQQSEERARKGKGYKKKGK